MQARVEKLVGFQGGDNVWEGVQGITEPLRAYSMECRTKREAVIVTRMQRP